MTTTVPDLPPSDIDTSNWSTFTNERVEFSFKYPPNYDLEYRNFRDSVIITSPHKYPSDKMGQDYSAYLITVEERVIRRHTLEEVESYLQEGRPAVAFVYNINGNPATPILFGKAEPPFERYVYIIDLEQGVLYVITSVKYSTSPAPEHDNAFEGIYRTFTVY